MVTLSYGGLVLQMRNPDLGNQDSLEYTRVSRSTTGGDTIIFRAITWPKIEKLTVNFDHCGPNQMELLKYFIKVTLGKQFSYVDQDGLTWTALITNPNTAIKQRGRTSYVVQLELEADRV